ncbi:Uncharacterised protein [Vibrio cholerae]|nr:Uncharacterised protein [Vibrio cholerae]
MHASLLAQTVWEGFRFNGFPINQRRVNHFWIAPTTNDFHMMIGEILTITFHHW